MQEAETQTVQPEVRCKLYQPTFVSLPEPLGGPTRAVPPGYVTHDRYGNPLAKPRPPTRREKCAATMGKTHCNSAQTHAALTAAMLAGVELPKGKKRPRKR